MADIYNAFGFDAMNVPYINPSDPKPRIKAEAITGSDLPDIVPTPDYN